MSVELSGDSTSATFVRSYSAVELGKIVNDQDEEDKHFTVKIIF